MRSTVREPATYLGADLTDATAPGQRPIDVCGLLREGGALKATFWQWLYEDGGVQNVAPLLAEIRAARGAVLDGPQALAAPGSTMRAAERRLAAAGKTPDTLPTKGPFCGFVRTSVQLFAALHAAGIPVSTTPLVGAVAEHYPGANWRRLAGPLPPKRHPAGLAVRRALLEVLGVSFGDSPLGDDHLDACLGAVIAAAADGAVEGADVERVGPALSIEDGVLREGPILLLRVRGELADRIRISIGKPSP